MVPPERVAEITDVRPKQCERCHEPLAGIDPNPHRHQIVDVPREPATAVEYRLHSLVCTGCGTATRAALPDGVSRRVFGPNLVALIALLGGSYRLSKRLIESIIADVYGIDISLGSVAKLEQEMAAALAPAHEEAATYVHKAQVVNADETGWTEARKKAWLWVAVAVHVAVFLIRCNRNAKAARELVGESFRGILGADRFSAYAWVDRSRRQLCWAHLKRDFTSFADHGLLEGGISDNLLVEMRRMMRWWHRVRDGTLSREDFQKKMRAVRRTVGELLRLGQRCGVPKVAGMCREILALEPALWTFVDEPGVEPTNNSAERALRRAVIWRKVSFGTDSERGSRFVERILTTVTTLRMQRRNVLDFLAETMAAHRRGRPMPSLLPAAPPQLAIAA